MHCFRRHQRLTQKCHYDSVFNRTEFRYGNSQFLVIASRRTDDAPGRLGLVASKKHLKSSVGRNRFKRLARESFRLHQQALAGCDIVVLSRSQSLALQPSELDVVWSRLHKRFSKPSSQVPVQ